MDTSAIDRPEPATLWRPDPERVHDTALVRFTRWAGMCRDTRIDDELDYRALHAWSVRDPAGFWSAAAGFLEVTFHDPPEAVLHSTETAAAQWFPGGTLNYAEHALTDAPGRHDGDTAVAFVREDGVESTVSYGELRDLVARTRTGLVAAGVRRGDRVVALAPNCVETLVMFLAAASLGAIWSSCSPDLETTAVLDRFAQLEPQVLLAVDGYCHGGNRFDIRDRLSVLRDRLPTVHTTVLVPYLDLGPVLTGATRWSEFTATAEALAFDPVPFDHPLWVLYSSGATGRLNPIVHGHGGIVLEHLKALRLQSDLGPGDRFFWLTTTGSMRWNFLIGGLLVGATVVLFDGNPAHPDMGVLWGLTEKYRIRAVGISAEFIRACMHAGINVRERYGLSAVQSLMVTGSPLSIDEVRWITEHINEQVQACFVHGDPDACTNLLDAAPTVEVRFGEPSCATLGADLSTELGEPVLNRPLPSMPVTVWKAPAAAQAR